MTTKGAPPISVALIQFLALTLSSAARRQARRERLDRATGRPRDAPRQPAPPAHGAGGGASGLAIGAGPLPHGAGGGGSGLAIGAAPPPHGGWATLEAPADQAAPAMGDQLSPTDWIATAYPWSGMVQAAPAPVPTGPPRRVSAPAPLLAPPAVALPAHRPVGRPSPAALASSPGPVARPPRPAARPPAPQPEAERPTPLLLLAEREAIRRAILERDLPARPSPASAAPASAAPAPAPWQPSWLKGPSTPAAQLAPQAPAPPPDPFRPGPAAPHPPLTREYLRELLAQILRDDALRHGLNLREG